MASLENRGNGSWRVVISAGYDGQGKKKRLQRIVKVDPNKTENAQRKEVEKQSSIIEADYLRHIITDSKKIHLEQVAREYLECKSITEKTKAGYKVLLEGRIIPALGNIAVQDLTAAHIRGFFKDLQKVKAGKRSKTGKLSGNSQLHYYRILRAVLNFAVKSGYISISPMIAVDAPKNDTKETDFYEPEEVAALLDVLDALDDSMWTAYYYLSLYSGCRPEELIGADWSDINGNTFSVAHGAARVHGVGTVRTPAPKTASSVRSIVLPAEVLNLLNKWKAEQAEYRLKFGAAWPEPNAIFTSDDGKRVDLSTPTQKFSKILKKNGLRHITLYSLRHTCASLLIASGRDPRSVAAHLGHSTPVLTLKTYSHAFEKAKAENAAVLTAAIASARKKAE